MSKLLNELDELLVDDVLLVELEELLDELEVLEELDELDKLDELDTLLFPFFFFLLLFDFFFPFLFNLLVVLLPCVAGVWDWVTLLEPLRFCDI